MVTNLKNKKPYKKLVDKIFFQTLGLFIVAIVVVFFIRSIGQGEIGNTLTNIISNIFDVDWEPAQLMYIYNIRKYFDLIIVGTVILIFAVFYKVFLSWFTRYFDEMIAGVNGIANRNEKINMSPELHFMEDTMNQIKSDLEKSAEAERDLEKRKNDLIVYLAHDIKTPLTSVIGYLSLLDETPDMPIEQKSKYIHITLEKAYRLEKLINEFFEITRYNLNSVPLSKEPIDLSYMLVQIVDEAYPQLTASEKEVSLNIPQDLNLYADSEKMARVFNNLLKNAIAYSKSHSVIEISAEWKENKTEIRFRNQGMIPQDKLDTIFDKFSRLDAARQSSTGGFGLGLAIAKDIITLHGGTIYAYSDQSHFTIVIEMPGRGNSK
ncbi:HAMP domain-containing histidine kinase [Paenibacillus albiflavus]|uniref:histidine kinase n=1 Tax=Paenibacillus albiflavus TaxID=2545760 RepID=A0A4R4EB39_9BACL|nr:HAMP domain-containing sensor histidine kinase [Paenibacillus albiflavus]TCZ77076.1 HAMP domain-containing histidine kinase [Paenibacillus albiflavus]